MKDCWKNGQMRAVILFCCYLSAAAQEVPADLTVEITNAETVPLDSYTSHSEFSTRMQQRFERKVLAATKSLLKYSKLESEQLLTNIDADQYLYFQLLHSLATDDVTFTKQLLEEVPESTSIPEPILSEWVQSNIALPLETMYRITDSIVRGENKRLFQIPNSVLEEVLLMMDKSEIFLESCKRGDVEIVQWFIGIGIDFDLTKPLEAAWKNGRLDIVKILLRNGALNNNDKIPDGFKNSVNATLLHLASSGSSPEAIETLLTAGAPINGVNENGESPLFLAIISNDFNATEIFIKNGADITLKANSGNTPLHAAALNGNLQAVKLLLDQDASINERNNLGLTPLHISDQSGIFYILKYLLNRNIRLPNVIISDQTASPYMYFLSEYGWLIQENDIELIQNYCEMTQLMNGRAARVPYEKEFKNNLLELVIKNNILFLTRCLINLGGELSITNRNNETLLFSAVRAGSYDIVRLLLNEGVDVEAMNINGTTALHLAAASGMLDIVALLLKRGADIDAVNKAGYTALHFAAKEGHIAIVNYLIERKISLAPTVNSYEQSVQETPLHLAAANAHLGIVKNFLEKGLFDDSGAKETWSTIHAASKAGHTDVVNVLLDNGYSVKTADNKGKTSLWWAAYSGSVSTVMALLEKEADVQTRSNRQFAGDKSTKVMLKSYETPLHVAAEKGHKEVCKLLIEKGIDKDAKDALLETPLYNAAKYGHFAVVKFLVERKANKNSRSRDRTSALHEAAAGGHEDVVEYLFDKGMDIEVQNEYLMTPLYFASKAGRISSVRQLIGFLADVNAITSQGESPLTAAVRGGHYEVVKFLLDNGAKIDIMDNEGNSLVMDAVSNVDRDMLVILLKRGASVYDSNRGDGRSVLHIATAGNTDVIQVLMENKPFYDGEAADGTTPLFEAVVHNNEPVVERLLYFYGYSMDIAVTRKGDNWTMLHVAVFQGSLNISKRLLKMNSKIINFQTTTKDTPLHFAVLRDHYDIVRMLLDKGADVDIKNSNGETPFDVALKENRTNILNLRLCNCLTSLNNRTHPL